MPFTSQKLSLILRSGVFAASRRMSAHGASWFETALTRLLTMRVPLDPKQLGIAGLYLFRHFLHPGGVFLHQLDVGNLPPPRLGLHLGMS
jgi:hypothetical protein